MPRKLKRLLRIPKIICLLLKRIRFDDLILYLITPYWLMEKTGFLRYFCKKYKISIFGLDEEDIKEFIKAVKKYG